MTFTKECTPRSRQRTNHPTAAEIAVWPQAWVDRLLSDALADDPVALAMALGPKEGDRS